MIEYGGTSADFLNDGRIESVETFFPATVPVYAVIETTHEGGLVVRKKERVHIWARVHLEGGGDSLVGLTLFNINHGGHAEDDGPNWRFIEYSEVP